MNDQYRGLILFISYLICGCIIFIPIVIAVWRNKKEMSLQIVQDKYILYLPKLYFGCGLGCAILFFLVILIFIPTIHDIFDLLFGTLVFMLFALLGTYLAVYSLLWKTEVSIDTLTFYSPFFPTCKIKLYEIADIKFTMYRMIIYTNKKKRYFIATEALGFDLLYEQLYNADKFERVQKTESFSVTRDTHEMVSNAILPLIFGGMLAALIITREENVEAYLYIICAGFALGGLYQWVECIMWKITVSFHRISVRSMLGGKKEFAMKDITMVYQEENDIIIYVKDKKVAKVFSNYKNFSLLLQCLLDRGILFYCK